MTHVDMNKFLREEDEEVGKKGGRASNSILGTDEDSDIVQEINIEELEETSNKPSK